MSTTPDDPWVRIEQLEAMAEHFRREIDRLSALKSVMKSKYEQLRIEHRDLTYERDHYMKKESV